MKKYKWIIILVNLFIVLGLFAKSVLKKEDTLENGTLVLLKLAPVDPRSLIQGDYMRLSYAVSRKIESNDKNGYCIVSLDENGIAKYERTQPNKTPIYEGEFPLNYTKHGWRANIGADSFFFQEGQAELYEKAQYGGLKIDDHGNSVLVGLYDEHKNFINPPDTSYDNVLDKY